MMYLSIGQVSDILRAAYRKDRAHHLMLLLSAMHGLRRSEVAALTLDDISEKGIHVRRCKGSLETTHPLLESANLLLDEKKSLAAWLEERPKGTNALFPDRKGVSSIRSNSVGKIAVRYMTMAGIPKQHCHHHSLKHFCCATMCRAGVGIEYIKKFVGHAALSSTIIYLGITDDEAAQKAQRVFRDALS